MKINMIIRCVLSNTQCFKIENKYNYKICGRKNRKYLLVSPCHPFFPKTGQTFNLIIMETSRKNQKSTTTLLVKCFQHKPSTNYCSSLQRQYTEYLYLSVSSDIPAYKVHVAGSQLCKLKQLCNQSSCVQSCKIVGKVKWVCK